MIEFTPSVSGRSSCFSENDVLDALRCPQALQHQSNFTGRPATNLFVTDTSVVKLRSDFVFQPKDAYRRALSALEKEQAVAVHHPSKTWFSLQIEQIGDVPVVGNITPRLFPFNSFIGDLLETNRDLAHERLHAFLNIYLAAAKSHDVRLDEGLSNIAWDDAGKVYYVDDDLYQWDEFTSFANVLPVWIRQLSMLTTDTAQFLGDAIVESILDNFGSAHPAYVLYGQLRENLSVPGRETECLSVISNALANATKKALHRRRQNIGTDIPPHESKASLPGSTEGQSKSLECISQQRFAVLADIHANLPALEAALDEIDREGIEQLLVLGDVVGYGPHPGECIQLLRDRQCLVIQGNHDFAAATGDTSRGFSRLASWAIDWTRKHISEADIDWLAHLSPVHRQDDWIAVHGSPIDKMYFFAYVYHMTYQANLDYLQKQDTHIAFHGHSHVQMHYWRNAKGEDGKSSDTECNLNSVRCALVCPGSVGQPRAGAAGAEFAIYDSGSGLLQMRRVQYCFDAVVADMTRHSFPSSLSERLLVGK
ncbi:hypothetical protein NBRC116494_34420 [Aurantivibrio plasticivorans]